MIYSHEVELMCPVAKGAKHEPAPIPEEGKWVHSKEIKDISGFTHGIGWCAPQYDGDVSIALRCYDQSGRFLYDELIFTRVGPDTMVLKSNDGNTLWLHPGDTFTR
mgnify:CR=1 FL=1